MNDNSNFGCLLKMSYSTIANIKIVKKKNLTKIVTMPLQKHIPKNILCGVK